MIRRCTKDDYQILNEYLYKRKELNLFVIGDIQNFGFEDQNLEIFIDYDLEIKTVYLRFFNNLCIVSYKMIVDLTFINELISTYSIVNINGEKDLISLININEFKQKNCLFASLNELSISVDTNGVSEVGLDRVPELLKKSNEIFNTESNIEATIKELKNNSKHIYTYLLDDEIISGASSSAESEDLAMIIGVFTLEDYRRQGYALKCVYSLCEKLLNEGKTVCLFYDNPNAAKMYEKIGFKFKGYFSMLKKD